MKTEGRLDRCTLKGQLGDAMFALLCAAGHNLRLILNFLRNFWHYFLAMLCFTSKP
jgi:IS5 family transposase